MRVMEKANNFSSFLDSDGSVSLHSLMISYLSFDLEFVVALVLSKDHQIKQALRKKHNTENLF